ncbi:MAG TPA: ABC transporter substrate-binding protein [Candidatus Binatia bacterium]|nr:ABC transporter substrate-binding protein [Candidatus Binatia bacterium]
MSKKPARSSLGFDPTIENPKSKIQNRDGWSRREFLSKAALAGAGTVLGLRPESHAGEGRPETTRLRLVHGPSMCQAPQYLAEELLRAEGFVDVRYAKKEKAQGVEQALASGEADITMHFVAPLLMRLEAGDAVVILAGGHVGCFELFANERVRTVRDLKGKTVGVLELGSSQHVFLASIMSYVGLNPSKDVDWVLYPPPEAKRLLAEGKIDAYLGFPPDPQELRAKNIAHVIVDSAAVRPWSQYFCCMIVGNRDFVRKNPTATKRAMRAILKAANICAVEPERSARALVEKWYATNYAYAVQVMKDLPYGKWREYDPEDTVRFYSLRLYESGLIKSNPQRIMAQGTDWSFLKELKKELKA